MAIKILDQYDGGVSSNAQSLISIFKANALYFEVS